MKYKAFIVRETPRGFIRSIEEKEIDSLPPGEVVIRTHYSSLNYKDALSASGHKGISKFYPHTPGIDAAGIVESSSNPQFSNGDRVLVTGYNLGMNTPGGFQEYIRVPASWIVKVRPGLSLKESMIFGTAGYTAALSLQKIQHVGIPEIDLPFLVTGASGGVGSMAVAILKKAGFKVTASTGKKEQYQFLQSLGATQVISREEVDDKLNRPLQKGRWRSVIDTVGGTILSSVIAQTTTFGSVAVCGLTQSSDLNTTVYPFILRGVNILGINSAETPMPLRLQIWDKLQNEWKPDVLSGMYEECTLEELSGNIDLILQGKITGRIIVNLSPNREA